MAFPLARVSFSYFSKELNISENDTRLLLFKLIHNGKLLGKIDLSTNEYIGGVISPDSYPNEQTFNHALSLKYKTEALIFKEEYNHFSPPSSSKELSLSFKPSNNMGWNFNWSNNNNNNDFFPRRAASTSYTNHRTDFFKQNDDDDWALQAALAASLQDAKPNTPIPKNDE